MDIKKNGGKQTDNPREENLKKDLWPSLRRGN